jgi:hypothetical protein
VPAYAGTVTESSSEKDSRRPYGSIRERTNSTNEADVVSRSYRSSGPIVRTS